MKKLAAVLTLLICWSAWGSDVNNPQLSGSLLNTITANNSATISDTTSFSSNYNEYQIVFDHIVPATNSVQFTCQVQSSGTSFQSTSYINVTPAITSGVDMLAGNTNLSSAVGWGYNGITMIHDANGSAYKYWDARNGAYTSNGTSLVQLNSGGMWNGNTTPVTGFQCQMSSGNIASGIVRVYGLR